MTNAEIAAAIRELGVLYELDGADRFRVIAYKEASRTIRDSPVSIEQLAKEGRLTELASIGKTLAEKITALIETGEIPAAEKLKAKIPPTLVEVTRIPGLGAKTVRRIHDELGVTDLESLAAAAKSGDLAEMKGLGEKAVQKILDGLEALSDAGPESERRLLSQVRPLAEELAAALRDSGTATEVVAAGSVRRWAETCKDIDLVAVSGDVTAMGEVLSGHELVLDSRSGGDAGVSVVTNTGISLDLRVTGPETFGNLLQHFTGSAQHNVELRERALRRGLSVSEHGVTEVEGGKVHRFAEEAGVYELLGLAYIEPELRQGRGEIAAAEDGSLPELVAAGDIRGDLHCHTTLSDGRNSLDEMAAAARKRGYAYLAITDHSASHGFGNHVTDAELERRIEEIAEWNSSAPKGFRLLAGSEVNIGTKGELDYPDELLAKLDWVIASVHTSFRIPEKAMTDRIIAAIGHPYVDCIGHLTGRLLLKRDPYGIDIERISEAAAANGTMLEINGNPNRRDLNEGHARIARDAGVKIVCNTDAHGIETLDNMAYGVATARRAWLTPDDVANTRAWRSFAPLRKRHRA